jgi:hypothetical protein
MHSTSSSYAIRNGAVYRWKDHIQGVKLVSECELDVTHHTVHSYVSGFWGPPQLSLSQVTGLERRSKKNGLRVMGGNTDELGDEIVELKEATLAIKSNVYAA